MRRNWKRIAAIAAMLIISVSVLGYQAIYRSGTKSETDAQATDQTAKAEVTIAEKRAELEAAEGQYSENSIVLADTSEDQATYLAEKLGAELRMTKSGDYAVLYLPEGVSIEDVYEDEEYEAFIPEMTPDYFVSVSAEDANYNTLYPSQPNYTLTDELYDQQTYLSYLNLSDTWSASKGSGVTVAIIDTGIDTDHPEFAGKISELSYNATTDRTVQDYGLEVIEDDYGHGTQVAGVLAAGMDNGGITGVAPEVELVVIKCQCDAYGQFLQGSDLVFGLAYAIECNVDVVNMSFGTDFNVYEKYTKLAADSDIICVASAGNNSSSLPTYPAADENVIGVGAMDDSWALTSYSNYGDNSELLAPGTVYTTTLNGGYTIATGTSMSSPIVAGAVALYLAQNPYTEFTKMEQLLQASSIDLGTLGEDWQNGFGALDIYALVCEEKGQITYDMLTDELSSQTQIFVKGHTVQRMLEPERDNVVLDGWFYDANATDECGYYQDIFSQDVTLYASWINEDEGSAYIYTTLPDGTVEIQSYTGKRRYLTIPAEIEGKTVSSIGEFAFSSNSRLRSVTLPETLTEIGQYAFAYCTSLRSIEIPESVQSIGAQAFSGCVTLSQVGIVTNGSLNSIGDGAFSMCGIRSVTLPVNLAELGEDVFFGSTSMTSIFAAEGNSAYQVKQEALYNAAGDTLLYYPAGRTSTYTVAEGTTTIGQSAFAYTKSQEIILPEKLKTLGKKAFAYGSIRKLSIPASVETLGEDMCSGCTSLSQVELKQNSAYSDIPQNAFQSCYSLKSIAVPNNVMSLGSCAFSCSGIQNISFDAGSQLYSIGSSAFEGTPIASIEIPESVAAIGSSAFFGCGNLKTVTFAGSSQCQTISDRAFYYCSALTEITLPDATDTIGELAFFQSGLRSITIGAGLTKLGNGVFSGCSGLEKIQVAAGNPEYAAYDGVLYDRNCTTLLMFPGARQGSYTLAETTTKIADYAFAGAKGLTDVTMNARLTEIGGYAFSGCSSMNTPALPETLETVGENAFEYCTAMQTKLLIPKSVISLGRYAFYQDYGLTEIVIEAESQLSRLGYGTLAYCGIQDFTVPASVSTMAQEVFTGCSNLIAVTFEADSQLKNLAAWTFSGADQLRQITFEEGSQLETIEARACEGLSKLERISLENCTQLKRIGNYAFNRCSSLSAVTLSTTLQDIGRYAFNGCTAMSEATIPATVEYIGRYAFNGTTAMNVYFKSATLPVTLEENWDYGIAGYYMGISSVQTSGDWTYAITEDREASVLGYSGSEANIILTTLDGYQVVSIGGSAFKNNTTLQSITLPDTLTGIYADAFAGTTSLKEITIPASVTTIDNEAFMNSGIASITFAPESKLQVLGHHAFAYTTNLKTLEIPAGVKKLRDYAFYKSGIQTITFAPDTKLEEIGRYVFAQSGLTAITLPDTVTTISYNAFRENENLKTLDLGNPEKLMIYGNAFYQTGLEQVCIPAGVTYLGEFCFTGCTNLTKITVSADNQNYASQDGVLLNKAGTKLITCPAGKTGSYAVDPNVTTLAFAAFEGSQLSEITIPEGSHLMTIGYRAFYDCDNLTSIQVPSSVQSIDNYAFAYCDNLETVTISAASQMSGIYKGAFYNCAQLTSILVPDSAQEIGDYAFYGCTAMTEVQLNTTSQLKLIGDYAFQYAGITALKMPEMLQEIGDYAFQGAKLETLGFNEAITYVGDYAFADCGLAKTTVLTIPETVEYLGYGAIRGAENIEELTLPFLGTTVDDVEQARLATIYGLYFQMFDGIQSLKKVTVQKCAVVGDFAFRNCFNIEQVILPETVTEIEDCAFESTYSLKNFNFNSGLSVLRFSAFNESNIEEAILPNGLERIESDCFTDCRNLKSVRLPESLNYIGAQAFKGTAISQVELSQNVAFCGEGAFSDCENLEEISVHSDNGYYASLDGILYDKAYTKIISVPVKISGNVIVPDGVQRIGDYTFSGCQMSGIQLPDSLTTIGNCAFSYCTNLKSIEVPDSVVSMANGVFMRCNGLEKAKLSASMEEIPSFTFHYAENLETVIIPNGVEIIGNYAFSNTAITEIELPESVKELGYSVFENCTKLERIIVDEKNQYFRAVEGILYDASMETLIFAPKGISGSIKIPEGVVKIADEAFMFCSALEEIELPNTVKSIGVYCFRFCENLESVVLQSGIEYIGNNAFYDTKLYNEQNSVNWEGNLLYIGEYLVDVDDDARNGKMNPEIYIRPGTTLIAATCFLSTNVQKVFMPDSMAYINYGAFYGAKNLKMVCLNTDLQEIGVDVFHNCTELQGIVIPAATTVDTGAFGGCTKLKYVILDGELDDNIFESTKIECIKVKNYASYYTSTMWRGLQEINPTVILDNTDEQEAVDCANGFDTVYTYAEHLDTSANPIGKIYYKDEWHLATFYINDFLVQMTPLTNGAVVQAPAESLIQEYLLDGMTFVGWDINGDGKADSIPATLDADIEAHAVLSTPITEISISQEQTLEVGDTAQLPVTYLPAYNNGLEQVTWTTSDETIAAVSQDGTITAVAAGTATITATLANQSEIMAQCEVTVTTPQPGIRLEATEGSLAVGETLTLTPRMILPDDDAAETIWQSSDPAVALVQDGTITALAPGKTNITITHGSYSSVYQLTVTAPLTAIQISNAPTEINVGETADLQVAYTPANTTDSRTVRWSSSNTAVATVSSAGKLTAIAPGTTTITATVGKFTQKLELTVYAPIQWIQLNTTTGTMRIDRTKQLEVIYEPSNTTDNKAATWSSDAPEIASVDQNGLVTAHQAGTAVITGTVGEHQATYTVTVVGLKDAATGIIVTNQDDTPMDENRGLSVEDISKTRPSRNDELQQGLADKLNHRYEVRGFEIFLHIGNDTVRPDKPVDVEIPISAPGEESQWHIYWVQQDGTYVDMNAHWEDGMLRFTTDHFSTYVVAKEAEHIPGDINNDGEVDTKDLVRLMKRIAQGDEDTTLDVSGDGKVDSEDVRRLMQYLADPTTEIH